MYIYYLAIQGQGRIRRARMTHLQFKTNFCEALTCNWPRRREEEPMHVQQIHVPKWTTLRRICVVCTTKRCNYYCEPCENKYMCSNKGCFENYHTQGWRYVGFFWAKFELLMSYCLRWSWKLLHNFPSPNISLSNSFFLNCTLHFSFPNLREGCFCSIFRTSLRYAHFPFSVPGLFFILFYLMFISYNFPFLCTLFFFYVFFFPFF